jgi:hypothetical protein
MARVVDGDADMNATLAGKRTKRRESELWGSGLGLGGQLGSWRSRWRQEWSRWRGGMEGNGEDKMEDCGWCREKPRRFFFAKVQVVTDILGWREYNNSTTDVAGWRGTRYTRPSRAEQPETDSITHPCDRPRQTCR